MSIQLRLLLRRRHRALERPPIEIHAEAVSVVHVEVVVRSSQLILREIDESRASLLEAREWQGSISVRSLSSFCNHVVIQEAKISQF